MQKIKFILIPAFLAAIFITSCQKEAFNEAEVTNQTITKQINNSFLNIPYSDSITLSKFNADAEIVNYNLARKIALLELDASGFRQELEWEGYTLSKMPVSIYGFDSKPKYYEYIVKDAEGYEVGTVNIEARRKSGAIVNELRKDVRDYNSIFSKSGDGMQLMADWSGTIHELGHQSHSQYMGNIQYWQVSKVVYESWAEVVEWAFTNDEYHTLGNELGVINAINHNHGRGKQTWRRSNSNWEYSPIFIDLIDDFNQRNNGMNGDRWHSGSTDFPNDQITGYSLSYIFYNILKDSYGLSSLSREIKEHKISGVTDDMVNELFELY